MSKLEVDAIEPQSGTTLTIGASGDSVNLGSGATIKLDGNYPVGTNNVALGSGALSDGGLSGVGSNTAVGSNSLASNTIGYSNSAFGTSSLFSNTEGRCNAAFGGVTLCLNTTGCNNTALGQLALRNNDTASNNTAVGYNSLNANTTGNGGVAVGTNAGAAITTGNCNIAIGYNALCTLTAGTDNIAIGRSAGLLITGTQGIRNTFLGSAAGSNATTACNNLLLGRNAGLAASPSGSITTQDHQVCLGDNEITDLYCADTTISSSDRRDKTDITDFTHGLDFVTKLNPKTYKWDKRSWYLTDNNQNILDVTPDGTYKKDRVNIGFMAQDVLALENEIGYGNSKKDMLFVSINADETAYGLKYERLVPVLVNAIKELKSQNEDLKSRIEVLENS
jgi:trimeric autotransporter adhesin